MKLQERADLESSVGTLPTPPVTTDELVDQKEWLLTIIQNPRPDLSNDAQLPKPEY